MLSSSMQTGCIQNQYVTEIEMNSRIKTNRVENELLENL